MQTKDKSCSRGDEERYFDYVLTPQAVPLQIMLSGLWSKFIKKKKIFFWFVLFFFIAGLKQKKKQKNPDLLDF